MPFSTLDRIYRTLLLTKYFIKGWGDPSDFKRLLEFRKIIANRNECLKLIPQNYPVRITEETISSGYHVINGYFISPFDQYLPGLLPAEAVRATFQVILPSNWTSKLYRPVCLHMAGTGDHFFWRRRNLIAKPLLREAGIGSIIIENPYYGTRKPQYQVRSVLHNVTDIFVMGGCLMLEALVLFNWCMQRGLGPLGVSGFSMGGHMASLAATNWPYPIVLVPCLSWTTASSVFTEGVMSNAIDWDVLNHQYKDFADIHKMLHVFDEELVMKPNFPMHMKNSLDHNFTLNGSNNFYQKIKTDLNSSQQQPILTSRKASRNIFLNYNVLDILKVFNFFSKSPPESSPGNIMRTALRDQTGIDWQKLKSLHLMRSIMDECTHIGNFSKPVDTSLVIIVCAQDDAYIPRDNVQDFVQLWPGAQVRYLKAGHISAFLLHQKKFRCAIKDCFERYKEKYM